MMALEPEQAAKKLFLAVQLIYLPTTIIITVVDLQTGVKKLLFGCYLVLVKIFSTLSLSSFFEIIIHCLGFISPYLGYLLGSRPSYGHDIAWYSTDVNVLLTLTGTVFAYTFNTLYLKRKHALIIRQEIAPPQQNLISLKKLMVGALVLALLALTVFVIKTLVSPCNMQTIEPLLVCYIVVGIQLFYSKNKSAWNHLKQVLRVKRDNLEFSRHMPGRGNRVSSVA